MCESVSVLVRDYCRVELQHTSFQLVSQQEPMKLTFFLKADHGFMKQKQKLHILF